MDSIKLLLDAPPQKEADNTQLLLKEHGEERSEGKGSVKEQDDTCLILQSSESEWLKHFRTDQN